MKTNQLHSLLAQYDLGKIHSLERLTKGYANENYKVDTDRDAYVLRLYKHLDKTGVIDVLKVIKHLQKSNFPVVCPLPNKAGQIINPTPLGQVVVFPFVFGEEPDVKTKHAAEMARGIAQLSLLEIEGLEKENPLDIESCDEVLSEIDTAPFQFPELFKSFRYYVNQLRPKLKINLPSGIVHGDIFPDNTIFENGRLKAVIDWEMVSVSPFLFEIGMTINGFCFRDNQFDPELFHAFLKSYQEVRSLTEKEMELLPFYIQWAAVTMAGWHLQNTLIYDGNRKQHARVKELLNRADQLSYYFKI